MKPLNLLYDTTSLQGIVIDPENEQCTDQFFFQSHSQNRYLFGS